MKFIKLSVVTALLSSVMPIHGGPDEHIQEDSGQVLKDGHSKIRVAKETWRILDAKTAKSSNGKVSKEPLASPTNKIKLGGTVYPRLDMEDFLSPNNKEQQDLLILAWQALYDRPWHDPLGFYQMAAMHANPVMPYDDSINEDLGVSFPSLL